MEEFIRNQTFISVVGYTLVILALTWAIWHSLDFRRFRKELCHWAEHFEEVLKSSQPRDLPRCLKTNPHPSAQLIVRILGNPELRTSVAGEVLAQETRRLLDPWARALGANRQRAVLAGFVGTLLGILSSAATYGANMDRAMMLQSLGLAMITTLIGAVAGELEAINLRRLEQLAASLDQASPELAARLAWMRREMNAAPRTPANGKERIDGPVRIRQTNLPVNGHGPPTASQYVPPYIGTPPAAADATTLAAKAPESGSNSHLTRDDSDHENLAY